MNAQLAQPGVLSDPATFAEYLTFELRDDATVEGATAALKQLRTIEKSIRQKDTTAQLSITTGFSDLAWSKLFPDDPMPSELHPFVERKDGGRHFPSTPGDIFFMVKSHRYDLNYQGAYYLLQAFAPIATLVEDIQGYKYLDDRDLIDFVDGTENPVSAAREEAVLMTASPYEGGSYLVVQRYTHQSEKWFAKTSEEQADVVGRTKFDDIELSDEKKPPTAHNAKSKVKVDGQEIKMFRQNRAWGNASDHGTMFVGFAASLSTLETSLKQMITADEDGYYDHLLDFVDAQTGNNYFIPPEAVMARFD